jgi:hypothetical protein
MAARTVRLDDEAEKTLARLRRLTGLTLSAASPAVASRSGATALGN